MKKVERSQLRDKVILPRQNVNFKYSIIFYFSSTLRFPWTNFLHGWLAGGR